MLDEHPRVLVCFDLSRGDRGQLKRRLVIDGPYPEQKVLRLRFIVWRSSAPEILVPRPLQACAEQNESMNVWR
jgi:hypothetical protein